MSILRFKVDSALLRELGEKLVETVHIALVELVKNCYDADATEVEIVFKSDSDGKSEIHVIDNGKGMNFNAIQSYWMRIATTNKAANDVSAVFGRPLTGAKGIGRFSCRRLGGKLRLISISTSEGNLVGLQPNVEKTEVLFPWTDFKPGTEVTDIDCPGEQITGTNYVTGTTLVITDITEEWNLRGWNWLKRQLAVLSANSGTQRKGFQDDPGFTVKIVAPDFEGGVRDIREDFINSGWGTLTAKINEKHQAVCELDALGIGKKTITSTQTFPHLNDISLRVGIMVGERAQMRDTSLNSLSNMEKILPEWGGVQVKYKNFRVFPYGDDDWLEIDKDRGIRKASPKNELLAFAQTLKGVDPSRTLLTMLSMRSYLGNVNIGETSKGFEMKLNREGFISSTAVDELKQFVRYSIDWSTIYRDFFIRQQAQEESLKAARDFEGLLNETIEPVKYIDAAIGYLEREVTNIVNTLPDYQRQNAQVSFLKATEVIKKQNASNKAELLHLRLVASTSTLLLIFSHEVKSLLGLLEQSKNSLTHLAVKLGIKERNEVLKITSTFSELKDRLDDLLKMTSLISVDQKQSKPGQVALKDKIIKVEKVFTLITHKYEIDIDYSGVANNIVIKNILEAEVYSVLLNVLSNSIKSVIAAGKNRRIQITAQRSDGFNVISVRDTGLGLDESKFNEVFIPFISDPEGELYKNLEKRLNPEDKMIVGSGSGLGLGIVQEIVNAHSGKVRFIKPPTGWSANLEIKLP
ncbi:ATP-binding protein [Mucilaginibacter sp. HMF5004]|uniref:ATP-binding protein n=1 Tax=Mucilaginibacter rivuli TaxID=2857527 RepID=UPI001C5DFD8C|nr:ATP-binding protein [Mucilaginibacter rivuli]MBW4889192.1 ATP-binding protein [Mucilaginibacter rivuli]